MAAAPSGPREGGAQRCRSVVTATRHAHLVESTALCLSRRGPSFFLFGSLTVPHCRRSDAAAEKLVLINCYRTRCHSFLFIYLFIPFPTLLHFCFPAAVAEHTQDFCSIEKSGTSILTCVCRVDLLGYLLRRRSIVIRCGSVASAGTTSGGFVSPGCSSPSLRGFSRFLPQSRDAHVRLAGDSKWSVGVNSSADGCVINPANCPRCDPPLSPPSTQDSGVDSSTPECRRKAFKH